MVHAKPLGLSWKKEEMKRKIFENMQKKKRKKKKLKNETNKTEKGDVRRIESSKRTEGTNLQH